MTAQAATPGTHARGSLAAAEPHPAASAAMAYLGRLSDQDLVSWQASFASCAIDDNRTAEICGETLQRILDGQTVGDRYVLGLAFTVMSGTKP